MITLALKAPRSRDHIVIPWRVLAETLAANEPFKNTTGSMKGTRGGTSFGGCDRRFTEAITEYPYTGRVWPIELSGAAYVVWSYHTPIAWRLGEEWTIPDIKYSLTTTGHQNLVRVAVHYLAPMGDVYERRLPAPEMDDGLIERARETMKRADLTIAGFDSVGIPILAGDHA